ncbi:hypothetical protein GCM10011519_27520 [Marmoricola endophyticus]|uniref:2-C-methyl-D-erythritol 4-phosphate cytidylyltransferase n=1 Tax=Marmoricola endophyticus TaxID=2040280 RepID=A0A917BP36_9ACTN|nr:2-C-methyl-D-erythritol 4-phosphate cytidylyltransferase [Marmoricola endophyticus]GGF52020.1 hypothetical protein GCM10011519_27520 [Marmoricola endophyticus]
MTDGTWLYDETPRPAGVVPDTGRGSLPFALLHGESLVACAAWAMGEAEVELVDLTVPWEDVRHSGRPLVVHDPLCPLTPPAFLAEAAALAAASGRVVVAYRPVTDTVKETDGDRVVGTRDREGLRQVVSPLVLPADVLAQLAAPAPGRPLDLDDLAASALALGASYDVEWLEAPTTAARVARVEDVELLESLSGAPGR